MLVPWSDGQVRVVVFFFNGCCAGWLNLLAVQSKWPLHARAHAAGRRRRNGDSLSDASPHMTLSLHVLSSVRRPLHGLRPQEFPLHRMYPFGACCNLCASAYTPFKNAESLKMQFLPPLDRVPCTMTCTATSGLPPRRTCWSVFSSVVLLLLPPLPSWQCRQTNLCGLLCSLLLGDYLTPWFCLVCLFFFKVVTHHFCRAASNTSG